MRVLASIIFTCFLVFWVACKTSTESTNTELRPAAGGKYYGGMFQMNEEEYFRTLYPHNVGEVGGHRVCNMVYEGLVRLNQKTLLTEPCIAERWDISADAKVYTFHLRHGVLFHDDPCFADGKGREVKANDVKYCLDKLCSASSDNIGYDFVRTRIVGAEAHYAASKDNKTSANGVEGIKVVDDYTLQITLSQPFSSFLHILAMPFGYIFPREAVEKYGAEMRIKTVGTGPFFMKAISENKAVVLLRNPHYWGKDSDGNSLPYLDGVRFSFINDKMAELLAFKQGKLDMVFKLPFEIQDEIVDRAGKLTPEYSNFVYQDVVSMSIQYYGFLTTGKIFNKKALRQAFAYAIDRQKLVDYTLKGSALPGSNGFVPPAFELYGQDAVKGYGFDPAKARQLLAEAGYPEGKGLPEITLQINSGGKRNEQVAEVVQKMLSENLNAKVNITKLPFAQHLEMQETGKVEFWRAGWIADYPDPENFLNFLWSKNLPADPSARTYTNTFRYKNANFDALLEEALRSTDDAKRFELYKKADQIATDDAPFLPLYYDKDKRLLQKRVRNFPQNPMEYRVLHEVYFEPNN